MGQDATATHTPGPLVLLDGSDGKGWDIETRERPGVDAVLVARVNRREDAVLFVAAAGMVEALDWLAGLIGSDHPYDWTESTINEVEQRIRAALCSIETTKPHPVAPRKPEPRRPTFEEACAATEAIAKVYDIDADCVEETVDLEPAPRFILCETNRDTGDGYFSGHESPEGALEYSAMQECADDWKPDRLYDVAAGKWVVGEVRTVVELDATFDDQG